FPLHASGFRIAGESIEAYDRALFIERLVNGPEILEQHQVLAPPRSELDQGAGDGLEALVQAVEDEELHQKRPTHIEPEVEHQVPLVQRRLEIELVQPLAKLKGLSMGCALLSRGRGLGVRHQFLSSTA